MTLPLSKRVIRDRQIVEDPWLHLADEDALPESGDITVSLERWQSDNDALKAYAGHVGLRLDSDTDVEETGLAINDIPLIVLDFPIIDTNKRGYHPVGKGYSQAYLLRTRLGFKGEIRARGPAVMRDVLFYMSRCGINSFEMDESKDINDALKAFNEMTVAYQPSADSMQPAFMRRRNTAA